MLYLYPKNTVDFTNNGDPIRHSFDEHVIRDDGFYLTFNLFLDKEEEYKKIKKEMIISAETPDGRNQFRVYDVKKKSTQVEIIAVQLMYDFDNKEVNPFSLKNASGAQIINRLKSSFKSTLGQFTMDSSVTELHDFTTNEEEDDTPSHNALEILNRITKRWDSELMLNGFDIRMIKRLGSKTDALLYEKKNISEFEDASSVSGMATRIHATSKFTPEGKEDEVTLSVTVDSPLINEYAQIYEKSYVNNDAKTEADLIAWVKLKYSTENIDKPSRTITVETNIIDGTEINYGDDLVMKYLVHDIDEVIRCVGYDYDPIKNTYYSVTLGDWKDSFATTLTGGIVDATNQQFNQIKNNITYISMSANGKNRNAHGPDPVPNPIDGDQWFYYELDRPDDVEYRVYQDGFWVKLDFFAAKKEVTEALDKADEAKQEAIDSYEKSITDAKAYTELKANEFNNQMEIVKADVADTVIKANAAVAKADKAIEDAGFMQIDLNATKQNAIDALTKAQTATDNLNTLSFSVDELTKTVGFKAEKTVVDAVTKQVNQHELSIAANAKEINLRMTSTQVDSLVTAKGYVNQAQLTATSTAWNVQLNQVSTDLNNLEIGGRNYIRETLSGYSAYNTVPTLSSNGTITFTKLGSTKYIAIFVSGWIPENSQYSLSGIMKKNGIPVKKSEWIHGRFQTQSPIESLYVNDATGYFEGTQTWTGSSQWIFHAYFDFSEGDIVTIEKFMMVKGNKPMDWTPAPEGMATVEKVASLELRIDGFQTVIADKVSSAQFNILSGQVSGKVATADFEAAMDLQSNNFNVRVSDVQKNLDNLEIGGRNLIILSDITAGKYLLETTGELGTAGNHSVTGFMSVFPNTDYMISAPILWQIRVIYYDVNKKYISGWLYSMNQGEKRSIKTPLNTAFVRLSGEIGGGSNRGSNPDVWKFEKGTVATDWSPAPEDMATKANLMAQINLNPEGILLQGKNIQLDGNVQMDAAFINKMKVYSMDAVYAEIATLKTKLFIADSVTAIMVKADAGLFDKVFINDTVVNKLTAKTSFINSVKAVEIAADKITTGIFNAAKVTIINLDASRIVSGSLVGIDIKSANGASTFEVRGGDMRLSVNGGDYMVLNPLGIIGYRSNGQKLFEANQSVVTSSALGTSVSNVYLAAKTGAAGSDGEARVVRYSTLGGDGAVGSYSYLPIRADSFKGAPGVNLYVVTDREVRITSDNSPNASYKNLRANGLYSGFLTTTTTSMWLGTDSMVHVVAKESIDQATNVYRDLRADNLRGNAVIYTGSNGYVGVDNEFRVMNIGLSGVYRNVRAADFIGSAFITSTEHAYIGTNKDLHVMDKNLSGSYKDVRAHDFIKVSSRDLKENIDKFDKPVLNSIMQLHTVEYNMKGEKEREIGFISEDSPLIANVDGKAVSGYKMDTIALKGIQELYLNQLEGSLEVQKLKEEMERLKQKIQKLESAA